jgi:hypothetical protein
MKGAILSSAAPKVSGSGYELQLLLEPRRRRRLPSRRVMRLRIFAEERNSPCYSLRTGGIARGLSPSVAERHLHFRRLSKNAYAAYERDNRENYLPAKPHNRRKGTGRRARTGKPLSAVSGAIAGRRLVVAALAERGRRGRRPRLQRRPGICPDYCLLTGLAKSNASRMLWSHFCAIGGERA